MKYSIITVGTNQLDKTVACVESVLANTENFEFILVDNASEDGTSGYFNELAERHPGKIKFIQGKKRLNFAQNNNLGIQVAEGEYIIFLNNDTVVGPNWIERIVAHFERVPLQPIGAIGPVSSMSNGRQMVGPQDPEKWYREHQGHWTHAGVLYGWCLVVPKEVLDKVGGFDEQFVNGHEDNDLCHRIQLAGYQLVIAYDTYIHHLGQGTLRHMYTSEEYGENGMANRERYFNKWYDPKPKKLVAVYRTNGGKHLEESLAQTSKFADHIIIHFCRAPRAFKIGVDYCTCGECMEAVPAQKEMEVDREAYVDILKEAFPKIHKIEWYDGIFQEDYERGWLLEQALELQKQGEADWCISVDDDEIYEDKFVQRVQKLMSPRDPEIFGYWTQWRTIWKEEMDKEYFRLDSTFGRFTNYRFFRLIPGQRIVSFHPEGHHCGSAPWFAQENLQWTSIRVKHLGYDTPEQRQKKFEFYEKNDNFKNAADIGNDDYSHLISKNVQLEEFRSDNGISLVMMVRDEEEHILGLLECMQYLVDEYVIVDTGSQDKTLEIIEKFKEYCPVPVHVYHYPWEDNFSTPRNYGIRLASQRWILHMDADERFGEGDLNQLMLMAETDHDFFLFHVLNYLEKPMVGKDPKYASTESVRLFRNIPELFYTGIVHETLDDALCALTRKRKISFERASFPLHHYGYLKTKNTVRGKLDSYEKLNNHQIEVTGDTDARPHFNLAMHYLNDDKEHEALRAFQHALKVNPRFWHAHQQMAALNIKSAKAFLNNVLIHIPKGHPFISKASELLEFLESNSFGCQKVT